MHDLHLPSEKLSDMKIVTEKEVLTIKKGKTNRMVKVTFTDASGCVMKYEVFFFIYIYNGLDIFKLSLLSSTV